MPTLLPKKKGLTFFLIAIIALTFTVWKSKNYFFGDASSVSTHSLSDHERAEMEEFQNEINESANKLAGIEAMWRQEFDRTKDLETGTIPKERLIGAFEVKQQKEAQMKLSGAHRGIAGINWIERGPSNIGGRTRALMFDKNDPSFKTVFAGGIGGGLWKTTDITLTTPTWTKVSDTYENIGISCIIQDPNTAQVMYFGTGEGWFNLGSQNGLGIWKSSDGGTSWSHLPSTINGNFTTVQKLAMASNGDLYAATSPAGIMRSKNGGASWSNVFTGSCADLEIASNGTIYITKGIFSPGSIWKSLGGVNAGNPGTFTNITPTSTGGFQRMEIGLSASDPNNLYVLCQGGASNDATDMFHSIDAGASWVPCNLTSAVVQDPIPTNTNFTRGQAWYDLVCEVDPLEPTTVYIGGIDVHRSENAGASWSPLTKWTSIITPSPAIPVVHADQHALVFKPGSSDIALFGNDGGVFYSNNLTLPSGLYTIPSKNFGYNVTQFYCVAVNPTAGSNYFLAGAQDNGTQRFNTVTGGVQSTTEATGGDGGFCHIDQLNASNQFSSYVYSSYYRSTNGGTSFSNTINDGTHGQFINPTDYDNVSKVFYSDYTLVSTRAGGSYARWLTSGSTNTGVTVSNFAGASASHVSVSPNVANRVYFGLTNGRVVYVDNANTATAVAGTIIRTGSGTVSGIAIEKNNENHIVVTYSNYGAQSVWETTDGGSNWTNIEGNLPDMPVRWVIFNPNSNDQLMIATELGVWSTDDINGASTEWNPTGSNMPNCRVDMLQVRESDNLVAAATYGRGVFTTTFTNSDVPLINFEKQTTFTTEAGPTTFTGCGTYGYKEIPVRFFISKAPVGDATVTINTNPNSTAILGQDYMLTSNSVTFPAGSTTPQTIMLRIINDHNIEETEHLELGLTVSGTTDAVKNTINQNFSIEILDDEKAPSAAFVGKLQVGDFTTNLGGSSPLQGSQSDKKMQYLYLASDLLASGVKAGDITGFSFEIGTKGSIQPFNGFTIKMGASSLSDLSSGFASTAGYNIIYSAPAGGYNTAAGTNEFLFNTPFNWDGTSNIIFEYCYNNATAPPAPPVAIPAGSGDDILRGQATSYISQARAVSTNQPGDDGCAFTTPSIYLGFRPLVKLYQLQPQTPVETILNSVSDFNLGPFETVHFYTNDRIIAKVQNLSDHNYGCVNINVDRAGTSALPFNNNLPANFVTSKSVFFTPQFDNPAGPLNFTLYYTDAEKLGWESTTGKVWSDASIIKVKSFHISDVTPTSPQVSESGSLASTTTGMLGADHFITGSFSTGFSGLGVGVPGGVVLPVQAVTLSGTYSANLAALKWRIESDTHLQSVTLQKSYNGSDFLDVNSTLFASRGNYDYSYNETAAKVFYRIKYNSSVGSTKYSNTILLSVGTKTAIAVYPNPFVDHVDIAFKNVSNTNLTVGLSTAFGTRLYSQQIKNFSGSRFSVNLINQVLARGTYFLTVQIGDEKETFKIIRQ